MTLCTPFRSRIGPIRVMAENFSGLGSMPRWEMMKPKSMPEALQTRIFRIELYSIGSKAVERDLEIGYQVVRLPGFYDDVVDICLYVPPEMVPEYMEHTPLICSSGVSEAKRHRDVTVHAEKCDKRGRKLVGLFHLDLVVTGISIKKG